MAQEMFFSAAASFKAGRLAECRDRLSRVHQTGFSRLQWYIEGNLLACRMQAQLRSGQDLPDILCSYESLWRKMSGVYPTSESLCAELCVALGVCQLQVLLSHWTLVAPFISSVVERVTAVLSSEAVTLSALSTVLAARDDAGAQVMVSCVEKMKVLQALVEAEKDGMGMANFSQVIALHSQWLGGDEAEALYRQAWQQYSSGDYQSALLTLSSPPLSSSSTPLTPLCHLLSGACYAGQAAPQLALLCWKKSMETASHPHQLLAALQNCALVCGEDHKASIDTRRLEIEALKCLPECGQTLPPLWVWLEEKEGGATAHISHRSVAEATYSLAWQEIQGHRHDKASEALEECLSAIQSGATVQVPSSLPPPSTLHLLRAHCVVCGHQDMMRGRTLCEDLIHTQSPTMPPLWRSEVMCILATACLHLGECADSRQWSLRSLEGLETASPGLNCQSHLLLIWQHVQHLLALGAIAHAQWREALQFLGCLLATPTGLYNHSLLQCRVGVVMGGATGWLGGRGKLPADKLEARQWLREARERLDQSSHSNTGVTLESSGSVGSGSDSDRTMVAMDMAMLSLWLTHNTTQHTQ